MIVHVLFEHSADRLPHGASYIRLLLPLQHPVNSDAWQVTHGPDYGGGADVVIVDRTWRPGPGVLDAAEALVERIRREGSCLIYSLDDNLLDWTPRSFAQTGPTAEQLSAVRLLAREADGILVSTEFLKDRLKHMNPRVYVIANALDERLVDERHEPMVGDARVIIGFMGTYSHEADLRLVLEPLRAILRAHADRLEFQLIGGMPASSLREAFKGLPLRVLDGDRPVDYPAFLRWFTTRVRWDIGLAPLEETTFTSGKSDVKFLDYAALGAAGIYSRVPAYANSVQTDVTGCLVDNTVPAWRAGLERLVSDGALRARLAQNARQYLFSKRTLRVCAQHWRQAILTILANSRGSDWT